MSQTNCIFCKIIARTVPATIIAEHDDIIVIKDIHPKAPVHLLIIPKKHIVDVQALNEQELTLAGKMFAMAQRLSAERGGQAFRLVVNSGHEAGQQVFHLHMHYLAGGLTTEL